MLLVSHRTLMVKSQLSRSRSRMVSTNIMAIMPLTMAMMRFLDHHGLGQTRLSLINLASEGGHEGHDCSCLLAELLFMADIRSLHCLPNSVCRYGRERESHKIACTHVAPSPL